ncbi:MAG: hypothetical protein GXY48_06815 [Methanomicrobiales archaeon]|nr:hypothetical protein [Methanomicrobiales archaeon]
MPHADAQLRRRICPFISSGQFIVYCRGSGCNGARPVLIEEDTFWVCVLIEGMRQIFPEVQDE